MAITNLLLKRNSRRLLHQTWELYDCLQTDEVTVVMGWTLVAARTKNSCGKDYVSALLLCSPLPWALEWVMTMSKSTHMNH